MPPSGRCCRPRAELVGQGFGEIAESFHRLFGPGAAIDRLGVDCRPDGEVGGRLDLELGEAGEFLVLLGDPRIDGVALACELLEDLGRQLPVDRPRVD